ncbi:DUF4386 domain-containing protein [Arthrobacter sp. CAN_C5]|uniref:DUF4386 domain-containing protein n=1 Tax=Arthrobacter sp. CAN_C5 TaxID=2760706 RepID=UPI001AE11C19|nr:DUF4386 domain-containing protein [Arthrobacter sp. CAN_C5]MBP2216883.1 glucan phosphoethanolaminetransferase (alkaline phosphatase superfamily) [Arthrobacter sp. CAN_C5]
MKPSTLDYSKTEVPQRPMHFTTWSPRTAAIVAGVGLAGMAVLAVFANFGAIVPLIARGDAEQTAQNVSGAPFLFFAGVFGFFLVALLDVIVAGALYTLFRPVSRRVSAAAAWIRSAYAVLLVVALSQLVIGFSLSGDPEAALPVLESFNTIWVISQGLFGISLLLVGYLAFRSGFVPKVFGVLLAIAGIGYLADAVGMAFIHDFSAVFAQYLFVGEVAIIFWLLIAGRRLSTN